MNEFVNDFDIWQDALRKIDMNEQVLPIYNGKMLYENGRTYLQMQKILGCEPMQKSHKFCLNIDPESPSEDEVKKVDELYRLGVERGFIEDTLDDNYDDGCVDGECSDRSCDGEDCDRVNIASYDNSFDKPTTNMPQPVSRRPKYSARIPSYTIMYSATKDGQTKTGETYSNAVNPSSAKADAIAKLSRIGYDNVSILAIECGDPDMAGIDDSYTQEDDVLRNSSSIGIEDDMPTPSKSDDLNETELNANEDDYMYGNYNNQMKTNNRFRNTEDVYDGMNEAQITDDTDEIVNDILNEYDGEDKADEPKTEEPKTEAPKTEEPKTEEPKTEVPKTEEPKTEEPKTEEPKTEEPKTEEPKTEEQTNSNQAPDDNDDEFSFDIPSNDSASPDDDIADDSSDEGQSSNDDQMNAMMDDALAQSNDDGDAASTEGTNDASETAPGNLAGSGGSGAESADVEGVEPTEGQDSSNQDDTSTEELDNNKKAEYKDQFTKTFKNVMLKCDFKGKKFDDLTMQEMTQVYASLIPAWGSKPDPKRFMTDKELDQLHEITIEA